MEKEEWRECDNGDLFLKKCNCETWNQKYEIPIYYYITSSSICLTLQVPVLDVVGQPDIGAQLTKQCQVE